MKTTTDEKREFLISIIENMNEEEIDFMDNLFNLENIISTRELLNIFAPEMDQSKIDTAYPAEYAKRIREIYPDFDNGWNVYDYNNNRLFGEMRNIYNIIANKMFSFFRDATQNYIQNTI
jgi:hypothetical protein